MEHMVLGDKTEFDRLLSSFLTSNGLDNIADNRHVLEEVYNMTYTIKVLIR